MKHLLLLLKDNGRISTCMVIAEEKIRSQKTERPTSWKDPMTDKILSSYVQIASF